MEMLIAKSQENENVGSYIEYIESDTKGKLRKIIEGSVFNSAKVFITELFQNAYRAKAKNVYINIENDCIEIYDDGCGLKNTKSLLTFDYSQWNSTTEGFGMGFWSVLNIPELVSVDVKSRKYHIFLDVEKVRDTLAVDISTLDKFLKGFKVALKSDYILTNQCEIIDTLKECGKYMMFNVYINNEKIEKENLYDKIYGEYECIYNTRLFEAKISVSQNYHNYPEVYYENRLVEKLYEFPYIKAVIILKKNSVNLKEPDRNTIIYNKKRENLINKIQECIIDLCKNYLNDNQGNDIDKYAETLNTYLKPNDYSKFLYVDETLTLSQFDKINEIVKNNYKIDESKVLDVLNSTIDDNNEWVIVNDDIIESFDFQNISQDDCRDINELNINALKISDTIFVKKEIKIDGFEGYESNIVDIEDLEKIDTSDFNTNFNNEDITETFIESNNKDVAIDIKNKVNIKDLLKKNKYCMWVNANEVDLYLNYISIAEYNNVKIFKAKNTLYESYFKSIGLTHVSDLNNSIFNDYNIIKNNPISKKEEMFLLLLEPIRKMYKLEPNIFKIGNIESKVQFTLGGKEFPSKIRRNTSKKIETYAISRGNSIIFDRHAVNLKLFNLNIDKDNFSIGKHELKCLMYNLDTIAHELAHVLYGTIDNTKEHTIIEKKIAGEIIDYIIRKY